MKTILKIFGLILLLINVNCKAQQIVQTPKDIYKLKEKEQQFLNEPLKNLLKEIKPEIKMAYGSLDNPCYFSFRFISAEEIKRVSANSDILGLYVYVKEVVDEWGLSKRPKEIEFIWRKEDLKKYANFTIIRIKVRGKN